jgi:dihydrofolate synthase/folylpolyglutamate synthase
MELISEEPPVVLDSAHTPRSVAGVLDAFQQVFGREGVLVFGTVAGKDTQGMAKILAPAFPRIIITTPGTFRESHPREVFEHFKAYNPDTELVSAPEEALQRALDRLPPGEALLITGSFYLAAEIAKCFRRTDKEELQP